MPHLQEFETHLFISYAHIDNQPLTADQQGWVSRFHTSLDAMLSMRLGRAARIWRDRKLSGNDVFSEEIASQFPKTALLVSILSPRYVASDWCARELRKFCEAARESGGVVVENKSRVIKVIKTPVASEAALPAILKDVLGYPFYIFDEQETPLELDPAYGPDMAQRYHLKVAKLAWDIAQQMKTLDAGRSDTQIQAVQVSLKPTVYLAECSWDQRHVREAIEAELRLQGYPVLPDRQLARDEASYVAEARRLLEQSKLSIHLVGASYGAVPDGPTQKSVVVLQNDLAVARSKAAGLRRIIWLPEQAESRHPEQQAFVEALHTSVEAQCGADLLIGDVETLKGAVHSALEALNTPAPVAPAAATSSSGQAALIYLLCDQRDREATRPLRRFLKGQGFEVHIPVFEGDAATVRRSNQELLTQCDAVIVFYGAGDESWKRTIEGDLRKAQAVRQGHLLLAATYVAQPVTEDKEDLIEMGESNLMNGLNGFFEGNLDAFIKACRGAIRS